MELHVIYVFTHDSIALGEDGPTYQPVEQLLALRSIPGLILLRRADANETVAASNRKREGRILEKGARAQRLRWASNSTKDPSFSDVKYIDTLIGPETINTVPLETLNAYRDHGDPSSRLEEGTEKAEAAIERLPQLGIDLAKLTQQLEDEGVAKFTTLC
jgi:transaldolase